MIDACGFVGSSPPVSIDCLNGSLDLIAHRGPDDLGTFIDDFVALGHHRLAIQDLSPNGHQPMSTQDGLVSIVFNGEIYNHLDIRKSLSANISFKSSSDTETILYAYLEMGPDVLKHLNGIFAFVIYDRRTNELFVVRDQLGVKPLYYSLRNGRLTFASELKSLLAMDGSNLTVDPRSLVDYMHYLWCPSPRTPFTEVKKLEPGHYFTFRLGDRSNEIQVKKYYELPYSGKRSVKSESELVDELDSLMCQAVQRQLLSDVPVGFFLSGGVDSSLIVAVAKRISSKNFNCYTIDSNIGKSQEGFSDDLSYARKVADYLDVPLNVVDGREDIIEDFDRMIWHLDEPQADPAPLHVWNICRAARKAGDVVLLGGTGGDDLFSGYRRHQAMIIEKWLSKIPLWVGVSTNRLIQSIPSNVAGARRARKLATGLGLSSLERMANYFAWIDLKVNKSLFSPEFQHEIGDYRPSSILIDSLTRIPGEQSPLNQMLFWDTKYFLADHNLNYTDKMSMASGVEVRVPFLDLDLVRFACELPVEMKLRGNTTKYILKKVAERYLPKDVIYRPKSGFGAPVRQWVMSGKLDSLVARIDFGGIKTRSVFSQPAVENLLADVKSGKIDASYTIWSILAIDSWQRQFLPMGTADESPSRLGPLSRPPLTPRKFR